MIAPKRKRLFFKFKGNISFNPDSHNLVGIDTHPRYRINPITLLEILFWSPNPKSVANGYSLDSESGLYLKNMTETTDDEAKIDFLAMKLTPPFGFVDGKSYAEYVFRTFNEEYQAELKRRFDALESDDQQETFIFHYTLVTKKLVDENLKNFVRVSYDS